MAGVRGVSWRTEETLDLLALWGKCSVQEVLRQSHQNLDIYQDISLEMAARGHHRSALLCRSKIKSLCLEYKRMVQHNNASGNAKVTCPFYDELHRILRGDASVHPRRVTNSLQLESPSPITNNQGQNPTPAEGSQELFTQNMDGDDEIEEDEQASTSTSRSGGQAQEERADGDAGDDTTVDFEPEPVSGGQAQEERADGNAGDDAVVDLEAEPGPCTAQEERADGDPGDDATEDLEPESGSSGQAQEERIEGDAGDDATVDLELEPGSGGQAQEERADVEAGDDATVDLEPEPGSGRQAQEERADGDAADDATVDLEPEPGSGGQDQEQRADGDAADDAMVDLEPEPGSSGQAQEQRADGDAADDAMVDLEPEPGSCGQAQEERADGDAGDDTTVDLEAEPGSGGQALEERADGDAGDDAMVDLQQEPGSGGQSQEERADGDPGDDRMVDLEPEPGSSGQAQEERADGVPGDDTTVDLEPEPDRTERNKPDHRSSGQGPLSSIKAVIKRTSRTSGYGEQQRERRRPEITIVAAEPLRPSSWFPSGGRVPQQGLVSPPSPIPGSWRTNELVLAEPPSYEQVIKEINQVQVGTTSHNNAVGTANSKCTATSSTQTDFPEEIISNSLGVNEKSNPHAVCECETTPAVQIPRTPPRPFPSLLNNNPSKNEDLLVVLEEQTCQEKPNAALCPVPKPRSKANLKPVVKETQNNTEDNHEETSQSRNSSSVQLESLLDDSLLDSHVVMVSMDINKSQSSIVSRTKALETQANAETSGLVKQPEIPPRPLAHKPIFSVIKPVVAPKPGVTRTSGEWDSWTENKFKVSQERHLQPQEAGSSITTKPELPKKPKPDTVKSSTNGPLNTGGRSTSENTEGQKKYPIPAPRPLVPKKSISFESPAAPLIPLQPPTSASRLSVAAQANASRSLGEPTASSLSAPPRQSTPSREGDLISFDDDVSPVNSDGAVPELAHSESDLLNLPSKKEPAKEQVIQPAIVRKPTVIRIPSKTAKALNEVSESPPPLPAEKPIGNTCSISTEKPNNIKAPKKESECSGLTQLSKNEPTMPSRRGIRFRTAILFTPTIGLYEFWQRISHRPVEGKNIPARPPPPKGAPGRPPPPKNTKTKPSSRTDNFCRSSSDTILHKKHSMFGLGVKRAKSQINKNQDPALPPRPKPGHPLYSKYMLPVPHGIAKEDISPKNTGGLSCKRGDVLVLVDHIDSNYIECQRGEETGKVRLSQVEIITPIDESSRNREKDSDNTQTISDTSVPHAVVLHDFLAEDPDDLGLNSGETVYLLKKIDDEWYRGKCKNRTGIFPASFVKVIVDIPGESNRKKVPSSSPSVTGPRCVSRFEYIGDKNDELSFSEGEIIILKEYVNEEWAKGELRGASGIFPLNFVEVIEDLPAPDGGASLKNEKGNCASLTQLEQHSGKWCDALYDFTAETNEDLSFKRGDHILILERVDSEWYKGRLNGKEGIFPANFVHVCSEGPKPAPWKRRCQALHDFQAENVDELSFKAGDMITDLESVGEDWMSGELHGKSGIFPKNFVQILQ